MKQLGKFPEKHSDMILTAILIGLLMVLIYFYFDYYYELNDDVLIKDILSGEYTGTPEGHNIQLLWPLSALVSLFYRMARPIPWYGLFLCGIQYLCIGMLLHRTLTYAQSKKGKICISGLVTGLVLVLYLEHLVFVHYSVTAALMAATAAYLFYTLPVGLERKVFFRNSMVSVTLIFLAVCLRPNMMLLLLPFVGVTGFIRWSREKEPLCRENMIRFCSVIAAILFVVAGSFLADKIAYSSTEWSRFETLFANRTELYDFQVIPSYEEHQAFYREIGLEQSQQQLLVNYNYGLDENITEITIGQVAEYAKTMKDAKIKERIRTALWEYSHRFFQETDYPWNAVILMLYVVMFFTILLRQDGRFLGNLWVAVWRLGLLFFVRTVLWMYILINGRCPVRISHSLYLMELCILFAMLMMEYTRKLRDKNFLILLTGCVLLFAVILMIPYRLQNVQKRVEKQEAVNVYGDSIENYCAARTDRFYYLDVYSTIIDGDSFADKMFANVDNTYVNHDLLGGWSCNSPLYRKKQAVMGLQGPFFDLIGSQDTRCYVIAKLETDINWLKDFYRDKGIPVLLREVDQIDQYYGVYKVEAQQY